MDKKKVLIIGSRNYANRRILHECKKLGLNAMITEPEHYIMSVSDQIGNDKIFYKGHRIYKNSVDFIISRIGNNFSTGVKVIEHLTQNLGIPASASSSGLLGASDKFLCSQIISKAKVLTPKSVYFQNTTEYKLLVKLVGGYPFVCKTITGSQGAGVFIINDELAGSTALSTISKIQKVVLQQYVETAENNKDKCDIRAFVVNGVVVAAMKRFAVKGDFRSNYSISKNAEKVTLTTDQTEMAINTAAALDLSICGVDIVSEVKIKKDYIIEANGNPGFSISKVTGINIAKKIAEYAQSITAIKEDEYLKALRNVSDRDANDIELKVYDYDPGLDENAIFTAYEQEQEFSKVYDQVTGMSQYVASLNGEEKKDIVHQISTTKQIEATIQDLKHRIMVAEIEQRITALERKHHKHH